MITGRSQRTREQLNISSIRKTAQHKTEGRPRLLLPGTAHAFRAFTHLFPVTLPASRHNVKPEGWPQPDRVDDEEKSIPGLHRTTGFNITFPSCPPWGGTLATACLHFLAWASGQPLYMDNCFIVLGSWRVFVVSPREGREGVGAVGRALSPT